MDCITIGQGAPAYYDHINVYNSCRSPSTVHTQNTGLQRYFIRYLLQRAISVFKWSIPEQWGKNYMLYTLYCWGFFAVVNTDKFGVIPQACSLKGYDVFYQPTNAVIVNPLLRGIMEPRIGTQCTLFRLQPDYGGIMDLVSYYADMLALTAEAVGVNLVNSKLAYVFTASDKTSAESLKKLYDRIASGEPAVVQDKHLLTQDGKPAWDSFIQNVGQNYITDKLLSDLRKIVAMFDTEIGIPNANTDKRERLITDEVNANNAETFTRCAMWLEELQQSCKKANDMFGLSMSVNWRVNPFSSMSAEPEKPKEVSEE